LIGVVLRLSAPRLLFLGLLCIHCAVGGLISRLNKLIDQIILEIDLNSFLGASLRLVRLSDSLFLGGKGGAIVLIDGLLGKKKVSNNLSLLFDGSKYGESVEISILGVLVDVIHLVDEEEVELDELGKLGRKSRCARLLGLCVGLRIEIGSGSGLDSIGVVGRAGGGVDSLVLLGSARLLCLGLGCAGHSGSSGLDGGLESRVAGRRDGVRGLVLVLLRSARLLCLDVDDLVAGNR